VRVASLGSGSRGNATLVAAGATKLLIDCGFSLREASRRLERLGVAPRELDAILVTHEHGDHASGVAALSRAHGVPVYATHGTHGSGRLEACAELRRFNAGDDFRVGAVAVHSVPVPHDAREPCQFRLRSGDADLGILTDLGSVTAHVVERYRGCRTLVLEFNHDCAMLAAGDYPPALKRRVGGDWGHLNNRQACELLAALGEEGPEQLVVAHVSEKNNSRGAVLDCLGAHQPHWVERALFADQGAGLGWLEVVPGGDGPLCAVRGQGQLGDAGVLVSPGAD
jgi:phosphoribosyl 1,2-cyclic phosphodiesterase